MNNGKILVDSNIIIYAINRPSPKHKDSQSFLIKNQAKLAVAHQNILECLRVLTHPKFINPMRVDKAVVSVTNITDALELVTPDKSSIHLALMLIERHKLKGDKIFDAYLAATALANDINTIATDNQKDFKVFTELNIIDPFKA